MLDQKWNYEIPLVFYYVVLTWTLSTRKSGKIQARIDCRLDIWERGIYTGMVVDALVEVRARKGLVERHK